MIWKTAITILIFLVLVFGFSFGLQNLPMKPIELKVNYLNPESLNIIDYGAVPVFAKNLRFNHNLISYSIEKDCDISHRKNMVAAFNIFSSEVKLISFYEKSNDADIDVECSDKSIELGKELFAAGEGGPSKIINTSGFKVIEKGKVVLYKGIDCNYPIVALHELGHVFGFDHSPNPKNIMFNVSRCDQRMSEDMDEIMMKLYSIEALSDAKIESVSGNVDGRYLNFNISILNEGLIGIDNINLTIFGDGEIIDSIELGNIEIGYGRTLRLENMRLPHNIKKLKFVLDAKNAIRELDEDNNIVEMEPKVQ